MRGLSFIRLAPFADRGSRHGGTTIRAIADEPAVVEWIDARRIQCISPLDSLKLRYRMRDDYGVASASIGVQVNGSPAVAIPIALPGSVKEREASVTIS